MCGVFGYVGPEIDAGSAIVTALKTLEYRGYDSWGLALATTEGLIVDKEIGRINGHARRYPLASLGIGHTRWATHGGVTAANAHPHVDCRGRIAVVHNGIIENYLELRAELEANGHPFRSETDSEVVAHLIEEKLAQGESLPAAMQGVLQRIKGYNAVVVMDVLDHQFVAAKHVSPLVVGLGDGGSLIASDAIALQGQASGLVYLEDEHLVILTEHGAEFFDHSRRVAIAPTIVEPIASARDNGHQGFADFMSKEIAEQPGRIRQLVSESFEEVAGLAELIQSHERVILVGCGTASNAALAGTYIFGQVAGRDVEAIPGSEFLQRAYNLAGSTLVIGLSQSGETIDLLEAMHTARQKGATLAALVNTPHSSLDRLVDRRVYLRAGPEQCVLATKSYTAKLAILLLTAHALSDQWQDGADSLTHAADAIELLLSGDALEKTQGLGAMISHAEHLFVVGRGLHYPSALEAALKIKEVSYIHAEGFAAGELKHGVIALVTNGTPCIVYAPVDETRADMVSSAMELRSRGGRIIGISSHDDAVFDDFIPIQDAGSANVLVEAIPSQLLGYYAALARGNDPDRPRNLAKSVTVK
jgi:glucosamine--fructose-6-phosphate aminotransferase (isomerizing)